MEKRISFEPVADRFLSVFGLPPISVKLDHWLGRPATRFAETSGSTDGDGSAIQENADLTAGNAEGLMEVGAGEIKEAQATLKGTRNWRLSWWRTIVKYTTTAHLWYRGKGFGINLANDDGFQVERDNSLRNPHNVQMTYLARAGYPGLVLWLAVQVAWAFAVARGYLLSWR